MANRNDLPVWQPASSHPLRELTRLQRRMNRMFEDMFSGEPFPSAEQAAFSPPVDVEETDTQFLIHMDLPGMKKDDLKIEVRDNFLVVAGERKHEQREKSRGRLSEERFYGSFMRSFQLPTNVDPGKIDADYANGVLKISLTKSAVSHPKQIQIKAA